LHQNILQAEQPQNQWHRLHRKPEQIVRCATGNFGSKAFDMGQRRGLDMRANGWN